MRLQKVTFCLLGYILVFVLFCISSFLSWIDARKINLQCTNTKVPLWCQPTTASGKEVFLCLTNYLQRTETFYHKMLNTTCVFTTTRGRTGPSSRFFMFGCNYFCFTFIRLIKLLFGYFCTKIKLHF